MTALISMEQIGAIVFGGAILVTGLLVVLAAFSMISSHYDDNRPRRRPQRQTGYDSATHHLELFDRQLDDVAARTGYPQPVAPSHTALAAANARADQLEAALRQMCEEYDREVAEHCAAFESDIAAWRQANAELADDNARLRQTVADLSGQLAEHVAPTAEQWCDRLGGTWEINPSLPSVALELLAGSATADLRHDLRNLVPVPA